MNLTMPPPLALFQRGRQSDIDALEPASPRCRGPDEGRRAWTRGNQAWKLAARAKYRYHVEPLSALREGATATVIARVAGSFPGSPVELTYRFDLADGKVASLAIR
jgi:hypothetical protein